jgi:phosphatidylethanolamine-binding protein (PEBP) family uncharacterized protein
VKLAVVMLLVGSIGCSAAGGPGDGGSLTPDGGATTPADSGAASDAGVADAGVFLLTSSVFLPQGDGGLVLPRAYTCDADGGGVSPPLEWSGVPQATSEFALVMSTVARDGVRFNWVVWSIPGSARALAAASTGGGIAGITSDGPQLAYAPPCSQGPGPKTYTFTLYALSQAPTLSNPPSTERGDVLQADIAAVTIGRAAVSVSSTRP